MCKLTSIYPTHCPILRLVVMSSAVDHILYHKMFVFCPYSIFKCTFYGNSPQMCNDITSNLEVGQSVFANSFFADDQQIRYVCCRFTHTVNSPSGSSFLFLLHVVLNKALCIMICITVKHRSMTPASSICTCAIQKCYWPDVTCCNVIPG